MKLLCIKNSCSDDKEAPLVKSGNYYTLIGVTTGLYLAGTENNLWYKLLETGPVVHHSSVFVIPETWNAENRDSKIKEIFEFVPSNI